MQNHSTLIIRFMTLNARYFRDFLAVSISGLALFFVAPLYISIHSDDGFQAFDVLVFFQVASTTFIIYTVLFSLAVAIGRFFKYDSLITVFATFVMVWVVVSALLFPVSGHSGMISPDGVPLDVVNLILASVAAVILSISVFTKLVWLPYIFSVVIVLGVAVELSGSIDEIGARSSNNISHNKVSLQNFSELSGDKNIIVLSFDGIPSNIVKDVLKNKADLKAEFKDFTFFHNAFSSSPATSASITGELFGNHNFREFGLDGERVSLDVDGALLPLNQLKNSYVYGAYGNFHNNSTKVIPSGVYYNLSSYNLFVDSFYRLELTLTRSIGSFGYRALRKLKVLDYIRNTAFYFYFIPKTALDTTMINYSNTSWKSGLVPQIYDFYGLVDSLKVGGSMTDSEPYLRMMHFVHTHFPVDFDENCAIRGTDKVWIDGNQNYQGLYNQGICELNQFAYFLNKLKRLGVYDNSLIVLKSDHGEPASYFHSEPYSLKINGHDMWGVNRYMPLLMIKDFNASNESIYYNDLLVGLPDLAITLCRASGLEDCDYFKGVDLTSPSREALNLSPHIFIDVVKDKTSSFSFDTQKTVKFDRRNGSSILDLFKNNKEINLE